MTETSSGLRDRIETVVRNHQAGLARRHEDRKAEMRGIESFRAEADRSIEAWRRDIIRPRIQELASFFTEEAQPPIEGTYDTSLTFKPSGRFNVGATVYLRLTPDASNRKVRARFEVAILPILLDYDRTREVELDIGGAEAFARFLDDCIVKFVEDYHRVHAPESPYQKGDIVRDPVCGMYFLRAEAMTSASHTGRSYYFCCESCQRRFEADPEAYARA